MSALEYYTINELRKEIGALHFLKSEEAYEIFRKDYERAYKADPACYDRLDEKTINMAEWDFFVMHMLEVPLLRVPLYINSSVPFIAKVCFLRLKGGA